MQQSNDVPKENEKIHISIFGTCVLRDMIGYSSTKYVVDRYVMDVSPVTLAAESPLIKPIDSAIFDYEIILKGNENLSHFRRRNFTLDLEKTVMNYFSEVSSEWLLLDFGCLRLGRKKYETGQVTISKGFGEIYFNLEREGYVPQGGIELAPESVSDEELYYSIDYTLEQVLKLYPQEKIILFNTRPVKFSGMKDGTISCFMPEKRYLPVEKGYAYALSKLPNVHLVDFLVNTISTEEHQWGRFPLHYVQEYYDYAYEAVNKITGGGVSLT